MATSRRSPVEAEVRFNRIKEISARIPNVVRTIIAEAVFQTHAMYASRVPVDTGLLKNSISSSMEVTLGGLVGVVYTNVHYAPYVEYGTRYMAARPALVPAFSIAAPRALAAMNKIEDRIK